MKRTLAQSAPRYAIAVILAAVLLVWLDDTLTARLYHTAYLSGWLLLAIIVVLAAYGIRKKFQSISLGSSGSWLKIHVSIALLSSVVFLLHVGFRIPNGLLEVVLSAAYLGVFLSGLTGLFLTITIPPLLTAGGRDINFDRIPLFVRKLRLEVEHVVFGTLSTSGQGAIAELYRNDLEPFFQRPRNLVAHLFHSQRPRQLLFVQVDRQQSQLSEQEFRVVQDLKNRIRQKDELDSQYALQFALKIWLLVHVPLTYGLLILAWFHLVAVHAFAGAF